MRRTLLRLANAATFAGATVACFTLLGTSNIDHPQPLTTGCAVHRADSVDSCTEGDARLVIQWSSAVNGEPLRLGAYAGAFGGCSAPHGEPPAGMEWDVCAPVRAELLPSDVDLGA